VDGRWQRSDTPTNFRAAAPFNGLRVGEACAVDVEDLGVERGRHRVEPTPALVRAG
jgi:hypothetical protein